MLPNNNHKLIQKDTTKILCSLCGKNEANPFLTLSNMPIQDGFLLPSKERALAVHKEDIILSFCNNCGFICNEGYDEKKVKKESYDFSLAASPSFREYVDETTDTLIDKFNLVEKNILEVGCGDAYFLEEICRKGNNKGIGIDPRIANKSLENASNGKLRFIQDNYAKSHEYLQVDFLISRHFFDLVEEPIVFLKTIHSHLRGQKKPIVYFEVPNTRHYLESSSIWKLAYEQRSWFTEENLAYIFTLCGFEILDIYPCMQSEFLAVEARPSLKVMNLAIVRSLQQRVDPALKNTIIRANEGLEELKSQAINRLDQLKKENKRLVAWGAGARAITFFNLFDYPDLFPLIVDVNDKRHRKYLPGSGQKIVSPEYLKSYKPDLVLITNPTYAEEIKAQVKSLGIETEFWVL